jgi:hypothetical protein
MSNLHALVIWTIYKNFEGYPDSLVALKFIAAQPTRQMLIAPDLESLRTAVQKMADYELIRKVRTENDDPDVVESWL